MRVLINFSATPLLLQLKDLFHAVGERTTDPVGMLCVNSSTRPFFGPRKAKQLILLPQHCHPGLMISVERAGRRQSIPSTLHTPANQCWINHEADVAAATGPALGRVTKILQEFF